MAARPRVTFVIMAGGKGERLWPVVRAAHPKVSLSPSGGRSLLAMTVDRLRAAWPGAEWLVVTTAGQESAVRGCLPPSMRSRVLVEPQVKNTAACLALAALVVAVKDPRRVLVVVPADHWVGQPAPFRRAVRSAIRAAGAYRSIAMIGVRPGRPHPGLGYLRVGEVLRRGRARGVYRLKRFIEKPSARAAKRLVAQRGTYWNTGIFIGTAETFVEWIAEQLPGHVKRLLPVAAYGRQGLARLAASPKARAAYQALPSVSFDIGVMKPMNRGVVVEGRFAWTDLGSWDAWAKASRNTVRRISVESDNVTVYGSPNHLIATVGVSDLVVVHTPTATLICRPDKVQAVREVVKRLSLGREFAPYR